MSGYNVDTINQLSWREAEEFEGNLPSIRVEAVAVGAKWYRTGKSCRHGHETVRLVSSKNCARCKLEENAKRYGRKVRERERPGFVAAETAMDRAKANNALPNRYRWRDLLEATLPWYAEAARLTKETGVEHVVDHQVGYCLGGQHEPVNLQVLTATENAAKAQMESEAALRPFLSSEDRDLSTLSPDTLRMLQNAVDAWGVELGLDLTSLDLEPKLGPSRPKSNSELTSQQLADLKRVCDAIRDRHTEGGFDL
jgi:hypothetical protein